MNELKKHALRSFQRALPIALLRARESTMRRFNKHVASYDLTLQQWRVIRALADEEPLDSKTLSERCVILAPSLTRIFKTLTQKGLIHSLKTADVRRHSVVLTQKGRALYQEASTTSEEIYLEIEDAFGHDKMEKLLELLEDLTKSTNSLPERK